VSRPSETLQAVVGTIIGTTFIILGAFTDLSKFTPKVVGAIVLLTSYIATVVTWYIASRQRAGALPSASDGSVK
jgi:hypothetical protein